MNFEDCYSPEPNTGCFIWTRSVNKFGYGSGTFTKRSDLKQEHAAHRWSYMLHYGEIPQGLWVLHSCDNPPCVNPRHLFLGNAVDNAKDRDRKGRGARGEKLVAAMAPNLLRGEDRKGTRLTQIKVREIRQLLFQGISCASIGRQFCVSTTTILGIKHRKTWAWLDTVSVPRRPVLAPAPKIKKCKPEPFSRTPRSLSRDVILDYFLRSIPIK